MPDTNRAVCVNRCCTAGDGVAGIAISAVVLAAPVAPAAVSVRVKSKRTCKVVVVVTLMTVSIVYFHS
jgi:hypothetical protein